MERMYFTPTQLNDLYLELQNKEIYFIDGQSSIYVPSQKTKYLDIEQCKEWPDLDGVVSLVTPGEAARLELERNFDKPRMIIKRKHLNRLDITPPRYFMGKSYSGGDLHYFDLEGAYCQLYRVLTLDIVYPRGMGELELDPVGSILASWKTARNSVIGITRSKRITAVKGKKIIEQTFKNPFFNPDLWLTIQMLLHEIANYALQEGSIYVSTDCYIFRRQRNADNFRDFLTSNSLKYHYYGGGGFVSGWSSYKVGARATRRTNRTTSYVRNIISSNGWVDWWAKWKKTKDVL